MSAPFGHVGLLHGVDSFHTTGGEDSSSCDGRGAWTRKVASEKKAVTLCRGPWSASIVMIGAIHHTSTISIISSIPRILLASGEDGIGPASVLDSRTLENILSIQSSYGHDRLSVCRLESNSSSTMGLTRDLSLSLSLPHESPYLTSSLLFSSRTWQTDFVHDHSGRMTPVSIP